MISRQDIEKLALLSRMEVSEVEKESMAKDIDSILSYVGQVKNLDASLATELPVLRNVMREDEVLHSPGEYTEDLLSLAPARDGNYLEVKKIL